MPPPNQHPLDIDLLAHASGEQIDPALDLDAHLDECLMCRIRVRRLRAVGAYQEPLLDASTRAAQIPPKVLEVLDEGRPRPEPAPGQLWLAGEPSRLLVWLMRVRGAEAVALPVTLDTAIADSETLLVADSPIGLSLGVLTGVIGNVPLNALSRFVGDLDIRDDVMALRTAQRTGSSTNLTVGPPILDSADERIEHRQLLADQLAALNPSPDDDDGILPPAAQPVGGSSDVLYGLIVDQMDVSRGPHCIVRPYSDPRILGVAASVHWTPIADVREVTCAVLVVGCGAVGTAVSIHAERAIRILDESHATALAFTELRSPYQTDVFERTDLTTAIEVPSGASVGARPAFGGLPVGDALFKYLDEAVTVVAGPTHLPMISPRPDLLSVMKGELANDIEQIWSTAWRIVSKQEAANSLRDQGADDLAELLRQARERGDDLLDEIVRIANQ